MTAVKMVKKVVYKISAILNITGVSLMVLMVLLIAADILGRVLFNKPLSGTYELVEYAMVIVIVFAMGYCQVRKGHIDVDSLVVLFPKPLQTIITYVVNFLGFAFFAIACWQTFRSGGMEFAAGTNSPVLLIVKWPFMYIASVGYALIAIVFLLQFIQPGDDPEIIGAAAVVDQDK